MKKVMIVGTGFGQLPLIDVCRKKGYQTVGVDYDEDSLGSSQVDKFFCIDVKDVDSVLALAKKEKIDAIVTMQSDLPVPTIGKVNDVLGLNGVSYETAMLCSNKDLTRKALIGSSIKQPNFIVVGSYKEAELSVTKIGLPCVIKAPDSSGSRGVTKVVSIDDVEDAYLEAFKYSRSKAIIVESFITGIEIGAQTFSQNGECLYCLIHNDTLCENGYMVPNSHSYPFNQVEINEEKVKLEIGKALIALGLKDGPANIDLIVTPTGEAHIIEIGARIGATCLPELTSIFTGLSWEEIVIDNALGLKHDVKEIAKKACAAVVLESPKDGVLIGVNHNYNLEDYRKYNPTIEITAIIGEQVNIFRKGTDRIGKVVVEAETVGIAECIANEIVSKIEFVISNA